MMKAIFPLAKKIFRIIFVQYATIWLMRIWTYKVRTKKNIVFAGEENKGQKRTKADGKRILSKSTLKKYKSDLEKLKSIWQTSWSIVNWFASEIGAGGSTL